MSSDKDAGLTNSAVAIEPAATIILVKDGVNGPKVLMQQRNPEALFVGGAWVFPGGKLDPGDYDAAWTKHFNLNSAKADQLLQVSKQAYAYWIGAIRELVEEAGILLASNADNASNRDNVAEPLALAAQTFLASNPDRFLEFCQTRELSLDTHKLKYLSRWVTPEDNPKRYDTRFFLAPWPEGQHARQDNHEAIDTCWISPEQALAQYEKGEWQLVLPTIVTLRQLCGFPNRAALLKNNGQTL